MEYNLGFAHFLAGTDGVARVVLGLMLVMSVGTWYLIVTKGVQAFLSKKRSRDFLAAFWRAPNLDAVATRLRESGVNEPFSHLVHHGFTAIEQHRAGRDGSRGLIDAGTPDEFLTRALKRAIGQDKSRLEYGQTFLATVASSAPFVGLFGTVWGIMNSFIGISKAQTTNLAIVAPGIAEALLATAIGLVAAIPAVVIYNFLARAITGYRQNLGDASAAIERLASRDLDVRRSLRHGAQRSERAAGSVVKIG